jgi:selenide,water dikinase
MSPEALAQVLQPLKNTFREEQFPDLLVGLGKADDAAVYRLAPDIAIVQTLDFFAPVVDDGYTYGAIAAVNAMSDVWAMGGEVLLALSIAAFPPNLPPEVAQDILRGAGDKVAAAGAVLAGGHTMEDKEPKFGLCVTGTVHPDKVVTKSNAQIGDVLVLTKPLGVGVITTALKREAADPVHVDTAVASMLLPNQAACRAMQTAGVHAATDITGFGLLGHSQEMAANSGVGLRFFVDSLPFLPGAHEYARKWVFPGGAYNNERFYKPHLSFADGIADETRLLLYDPETSGGLLISVARDRLATLEAEMRKASQAYWVVGEVVEGEGTVEVVRS